jgi:hypothetical protein
MGDGRDVLAVDHDAALFGREEAQQPHLKREPDQHRQGQRWLEQGHHRDRADAVPEANSEACRGTASGAASFGGIRRSAARSMARA